MFISKTVAAWALAVGVVTVGGGSAIAATMASNDTPVVHKLPVSLPKQAALPSQAQQAIKTVKGGVAKVKGALPKGAPAVPGGAPALPGGLTAPQCTTVPLSMTPGIPALPIGKLTLVSTVEKKLQVGNVPYCTVDETYTDPAGDQFTVKTVAGPSGLTAGGAATVLGLPQAGPTTVGGESGLSLNGGSTLVWLQHQGLAVSLTGNNATAPAALLALASQLQKQ